MGLYESMELEVIAAEQGSRVANNHVAADLATLGNGWDQVWSLATCMFAQVCNGLGPSVRRGKLSMRRYNRETKKWMPDPAILRRTADW